MDVKTVNTALQLAQLAANLFIELKKQSGLSNEELLDMAAQNNAEARDEARKFLESLK
jgi:hypothetical protein